MTAWTILQAVLVVCGVLEVSGVRMLGWGNGAINFGGKAFYPQTWDDKSTLTMSTSWKDDPGKTQEIEVKGKGIYDVLEEQLGPKLLWTYTLDDCVFVGDPSKYCVYSDTPSTLMVIVDKRCERRTYSAERQFQAAEVREADCQKLIKKIERDMASFGKKQTFPWNGPSTKSGTTSNAATTEISAKPVKPSSSAATVTSAKPVKLSSSASTVTSAKPVKLSSSASTVTSGASATSTDMSWLEKMRRNPWFSWMSFSLK